MLNTKSDKKSLKFPMNKKLAVKILGICIIIFLAGVFIGKAVTPTTTFSIFGGNYPGAPSYTVFTDGTNIFAKNANGVIAYSGTDAEIVIQEANDALPATGGEILIAAGTYEVNPIYLSDYTILRGESRESTKLVLSEETTFVLGEFNNVISGDNEADLENPNHDITVKDITIDVNFHVLEGGQESGFCAVGFIWGYRMTIDNIHAINGDGQVLGVWSVSEGSGGQTETASRITNCLVENSGSGRTHDAGIIISANNTELNIISNNIVRGIDGNGIEVEDFAKYSVIANNIVENVTHYGFYGSNVDYNTFSANIARDCDYSGFHIADSSHVKLVGNQATGNAFRGVDISNSEYCIAIGNDVSGNTQGGFGGASTDTIIGYNIGWVTENSGASEGTGAGQAIEHGLTGMPTLAVITPLESGTTIDYVYVDTTYIYTQVTNGKAYNWTVTMIYPQG